MLRGYSDDEIREYRKLGFTDFEIHTGIAEAVLDEKRWVETFEPEFVKGHPIHRLKEPWVVCRTPYKSKYTKVIGGVNV